LNTFEFVVLSGARAKQLLRGCTPKVERQHKAARTAMQEVKLKKIEKIATVEKAPGSGLEA
jgi:DNA-directed RNA polymerase subunit K/omega